MPIGLVLLWAIRTSVRRFMRQRTRVEVDDKPSPLRPERPDAPPLVLSKDAAPRVPQAGAARALLARMRRGRRNAAVLYFLAGLAASLVSFFLTGARAITEVYFVPGYLGATFITVTFVTLASTRLRLAALTCAGVLLAAAVYGYLMILSADRTVEVELLYDDTIFGLLLLVFIQNKWLKNTAPLVMLLLVIPFGAWYLAGMLRDEIVVAARIVFIIAGVGALFLLVRAYERKWFSDLSFHIGFVWVTFVTVFVMAGEKPERALPTLAVYAVLSRLMLPLLRRQARAHAPVNLLVLRVFGTPGRSQSLFEELGTRWRYAGPIHLIAGADSATANLDLSEAARYLTGRFRSLYISSDADREKRLAELDCAPDPDGRYRTNDFFCFDDTWRRTFIDLLARSDAVLVDLSGYGPQNLGVAFELGHLLGTRPLGSFVLVTDGKTDVEHLTATLQSLWRRLDPSLPNARVEHPVVRILHKPKPARLVAALCDAAVI